MIYYINIFYNIVFNKWKKKKKEKNKIKLLLSVNIHIKILKNYFLPIYDSSIQCKTIIILNKIIQLINTKSKF